MINAFRNPTTLTFDDYDPRASIVDPNDGSVSDAFTSFDFELLPNLPAERHNGRFRLQRTMSLSITPIALIRDDAAATDPGMPSLLSHEQLHYDVGFVIARQLARELNVIDSATERGLKRHRLDAPPRACHFHADDNPIACTLDAPRPPMSNQVAQIGAQRVGDFVAEFGMVGEGVGAHRRHTLTRSAETATQRASAPASSARNLRRRGRPRPAVRRLVPMERAHDQVVQRHPGRRRDQRVVQRHDTAAPGAYWRSAALAHRHQRRQHDGL